MTQNCEVDQAEKTADEILDPIEKLHANARDFLHSLGFFFEEEFYETHDKEVIIFYVQGEKKKIKCWLKCSYPEKNNVQGLCITFGAYSSTMPAHISRTFWTDSNSQLTEEERQAINKKLAEGRKKAEERENQDKKIGDDLANRCIEKYQNASPTGTSPYFARKGINPSDIRFETRKNYDDGKEESIALVPIRNIKGDIRALEEIYPSKRKFHPEEEPRDKNTLGKYTGCFFTFGKLEDGKQIIISEGYSTAASIFASTFYTSLMVVSRTNILNVAKAINKKYPNSQIIIFGDDDVETKDNPGRTDAIKAAIQINSEMPANKPKCKVVFAQFPIGKEHDDQSKAYKDANDLMFTCGKEEVKRQIDENVFIPEKPNNTNETKTHLEDDEIENGAEGKELIKAKASARRRAIMQELSYEEIVKDICKQYPAFKDKAVDIATKALQWAENYRPSCEIIFGGIPKKITNMKSLDERFAQLEAPGQPCVVIHRVDAQPIASKDFNQRLSGDVVLVGVDDKGQPKYVDAGKFWTGNTKKYIYKNIVFTNKPVKNDTYNLFTGFGIKPSNKGKCDKILVHIKDVICAGSMTNFEAFIKLLAWQIQNIGKPSRIITALKSKTQQVGKGALLQDILAVIYGNSGFVTSDLGQIITRFNDTIRGKAFIFLDEALFSGDRKAADAIKSLATSTRQGVESKGIPTVQFPIALNLFLATNHDDAAHVEESDARYWILEVSPHQAGNTAYFNDLYAEIEGGGREAFMHFLLNLDVKDFIPSRDVPKDNEFKDAMIRNSINPYDARKWLEQCCRDEMILGMKPLDKESKLPWESWQKGNEYANGMFNAAYVEWQKTVKSPIGAKPTPSNKFGELLTKAGLEQRIDGQRWRKLPDPNECLEIVNKMIEKIEK